MHDESKPEPITGHDTPNRTTFYPGYNGFPPGKRNDGYRSFEQHYSQLHLYNTNTSTLKWVNIAARRNRDNLGLFDSVSDSLELTDYQRRVGREWMGEIPLTTWSSPNGIDGYVAAICICATVLLRDFHCERGYNPDRKVENNDDVFLDLLDELSYSDEVIRSCYQKVYDFVTWESENRKESMN